MAHELFKTELESRTHEVLDSATVGMIKEASDRYFSVDNTVNGKEFFEKIILDSCKDYPTDDMRFYQSVTELKVRLGRVFDDTVAYEKLQIEKEIIELELEEMKAAKQTRKDELMIRLKEQELVQKRIRIAFAKEGLETTAKEIDQFKSLADQYAATGKIKPYAEARLEEMHKKIEARYLNNVLTGIPFTPSELAFYYTETGALKPPAGVPAKLAALGRPDLAQIEQSKIDAVERAQLALSNQTPATPLLETKTSYQDADSVGGIEIHNG